MNQVSPSEMFLKQELGLVFGFCFMFLIISMSMSILFQFSGLFAFHLVVVVSTYFCVNLFIQIIKSQEYGYLRLCIGDYFHLSFGVFYSVWVMKVTYGEVSWVYYGNENNMGTNVFSGLMHMSLKDGQQWVIQTGIICVKEGKLWKQRDVSFKWYCGEWCMKIIFNLLLIWRVGEGVLVLFTEWIGLWLMPDWILKEMKYIIWKCRNCLGYKMAMTGTFWPIIQSLKYEFLWLSNDWNSFCWRWFCQMKRSQSFVKIMEIRNWCKIDDLIWNMRKWMAVLLAIMRD